jgi:hypothetical protein
MTVGGHVWLGLLGKLKQAHLGSFFEAAGDHVSTYTDHLGGLNRLVRSALTLSGTGGSFLWYGHVIILSILL